MSKELTYNERNELITACQIGNLAEVKRLTVDVNVNNLWARVQPSDDIITPFHAACEAGHLPIVQYLHSIGAEINIKTKMRYLTPVHLANDIEVVKYLTSIEGIDLETYEGTTALVRACGDGNLDKVKHLVSCGSNIKSALHGWSYRTSNALDVVKYLISVGADWEHADGILGYTPFYNACLAPSLDVVRYLALIGANIQKLAGTQNRTPKEAVQSYLDSGIFSGSARAQCAKDIIHFLETWEKQPEFIFEVNGFADEVHLSGILFKFYCE